MHSTQRKLIVLIVFVCAVVALQQRWRLDLLLNPIPIENLSADQVVIYTTRWCGYCAKTRSYLERANVPYIDKDIESSEAALAEFQALGGRGVPLARIGSKRVHGFDPSALRDALDALGNSPG